MKSKQTISDSPRNYRFRNPHAIIVGSLILTAGLLVSVSLSKEVLWSALTAIGTLLAVAVALFYPPLRSRWLRPKLRIGPPDYAPNDYLRWATALQSRKRLFYADIQLFNDGRSTAKRCRPLLTGVGEKKENTWQRDLNWVPIGLEWILDEFERASQGKPTEDKDVIPHAPYIFKLGFVSPARPDTFMIGRYLILTGQRETFGPGNYCFEIKVVGENLEPITKYFYLEWLGQCPDKIEDVRRRLKVFARDDPPW